MSTAKRHLRVVSDEPASDIPPPAESQVRRKRSRADEPRADLYSEACKSLVGDCDKPCRYRLPTHRCVLQVAGDGPRTLRSVSLHMGCTRERVRQIEKSAIRRLRNRLRRNPTSKWAQYLTDLLHRLAPLIEDSDAKR